jgi:hypothetical protein
MPVCAECIHAELQCPPVIRCKVLKEFRYLDSPASEYFEPIEPEEKKETEKKK